MAVSTGTWALAHQRCRQHLRKLRTPARHDESCPWIEYDISGRTLFRIGGCTHPERAPGSHPVGPRCPRLREYFRLALRLPRPSVRQLESRHGVAGRHPSPRKRDHRTTQPARRREAKVSTAGGRGCGQVRGRRADVCLRSCSQARARRARPVRYAAAQAYIYAHTHTDGRAVFSCSLPRRLYTRLLCSVHGMRTRPPAPMPRGRRAHHMDTPVRAAGRSSSASPRFSSRLSCSTPSVSVDTLTIRMVRTYPVVQGRCLPLMPPSPLFCAQRYIHARLERLGGPCTRCGLRRLLGQVSTAALGQDVPNVPARRPNPRVDQSWREGHRWDVDRAGGGGGGVVAIVVDVRVETAGTVCWGTQVRAV